MNYKEEIALLTVNTLKEYLSNNDAIEKVMLNVYTLDDYNVFSKLLETGVFE